MNKHNNPIKSFCFKFFVIFMSLSFVSGIIYSKESKKGSNIKRQSKSKEKVQLVMFMNYPYQIYSNDPTKIHVTLFKPDFKPAKGAKVSVNKKFVGKTDKNGILIFDYKPGSRQSHTLAATLKDGKKTYKIIKTFSCNSRTVSFKADKLYVYTDRGVYNPGQDILVRLFTWQLKGEYSAVPNAKVQLLFQDNNRKIYSGEHVKTDEFGVGSTKLSLPENMPEGDYELVVLYKKARETASIRVKRFIPPVINIKHNLKRYLTDAQKQLNVEVKLGYFTGGKIKSSKLIFSVLTYDKKEIFKKTFSKKDFYNIKLSKKELNKFREKLAKEVTFKIKLAVIDSYKQKDEIIWDIIYTERPYTAVLELDKDAYNKNEKVQILAKVVDLDTQPAVNIPLIFEVVGLKIKKKVKTDAKGVAVFEFKMPEKGVTVNVKSPIMKPVLASRYIPYQPQKPMISKVSEPPKGAGCKTVIQVNFDPEYVPVEKVIHVDMTDISGALVVSTTIPVYKEKDKYYARGEITAPTWGTMLANLYCCAVAKKNAKKPFSVNTVGFITEGQHITFYPDREMEIIVENFKPKVAPGEKIKFKVKVKGGKGEKCLGVSIVDGAVISLLDPFINDPVNHFYNPQAKVISTGGAGVLTWPVVDRNWGSPWRDIAYCNWGWKSPGSFISSMHRKYSSAQDEMESNSYMDDAPSESKYAMKIPASKEKISKKGMVPSKAISGNGRNGDDDDQSNERAQKTIIIRTKFPETTLWEPKIITKNKKAEFEIKIPDAITTQKLSIIATDKDGFIGFIRKDIKVTQSLFIRAVFPPTMTYGDIIKVQALIRNQTDKKIRCRAKLTSFDNLKISGEKAVKLEVPANESAIAEWEISSKQCGKNKFTVSVETDGFKDLEKKNIYVLPVGEPKISLKKGSVKDSRDFKTKFILDKKSIYRVVNVNVTLPNIFPAIQAWYAFNNYSGYSPWMMAANAIMNSAMLDYVQNSDGNIKKIKLLRQKLNETGVQLSLQQFPTGAWGWYFFADVTAPDSRPVTGGENLYYTVYVLRALLEIRGRDLLVADEVMLKAIDFIFNKQNSKGLWSSKGAYFWEVFNTDTDYALSAEIFEVLMHAALLIPEAKKYDKDFTALKKKMLKLLKSQQEPMTVAAAVKGLIYWAKYKKDNSVLKIARQYIDHLIKLKRKAYWEPHWYHAYGGMVELNARILELLAEFDVKKYESYLREGITWLLSTREAWGAWHNEIGTANAIKALIKIGSFKKEKQSEITITVNGKEVAEIEIDPSDPYLSAAKLRYFEITKWVKDGENKVEIEYNGNLTAGAMVEVKEWGVEELKAKKLLKLKRTSPQKASLGESVPVKIILTSKKTLSMVTLVENILSNTEVDLKSLDKLKKAKKIMNYQVKDGKLYLVLEKIKGKVEFKYKLKTIHTGLAYHAGIKVIDTGKGVLLAFLVSSSLEVR